MGAETTALGRPQSHSTETQLAFAPHSTPAPTPARPPPATCSQAGCRARQALCSHFYLRA